MTFRRFGLVLALPLAAFAAGCEKPQAEITQPATDTVEDPRDNTTGTVSEPRDRPGGGGGDTSTTVNPPPRSESSESAPSSGAPDGGSAAIEVRPVTPAELQEAIAAHKGKAVLVDYWATWCVPCRKQFPHTVALSKKYGSDQLAVLSVSVDEPEQVADVKGFLAKHGGRIEHFVSSGGGAQEVIERFGIAGSVPHYKVFGRDGAPVASFGGDPERPIETAEVDAAVERAVAGSQT